MEFQGQATRTLDTESVVHKASQVAFGRPLVTNVLRSQLVEAMMALVLEPEWRLCSADYASWDFERPDGVRLEVKQSAAKQSWVTKKPSKAIFDIAARTGYWEEGAIWVAKPGRQAHLYVFAHHALYDEHADHRDPSQWDFYVVASPALPNNKTMSLSQVRKLCVPVSIADLSGQVRAVASIADRGFPLGTHDEP